MSRILLGIICGLVFGAIDIGIMLPMSFPDKKAAITAAFIARWNTGTFGSRYTRSEKSTSSAVTGIPSCQKALSRRR